MNNYGSDKEELDAMDKWTNEHLVTCPITNPGAIGGRFTYSFTPTSIGTVSTVQCACGAKHDATDYDRW